MSRRRKSTAKKVVRSLDDLTSAQMWELELGPASCGGTRCDRPGHHLPQQLGKLDDPERPDGTGLHRQRDGSYRSKPHALCSEWSTPEERREVWFACREELMFASGPGEHPWCFFAVEVGEVPLDQVAWLAEHDQLSPSETGQVLVLADRERKANNGSHRYTEAARIIRA